MNPEPEYVGAPWAIAISSVTESLAEGGAGGVHVAVPPALACAGVHGAPPPPDVPPVGGAPAPPVVQITSPANGAELDVSTIDIAGTVTGEGLLSPVKLTMTFARPPESTAPPFTSDLSLTGTGTTRQFSLLGFTSVPLGPITVTVTAENFAATQRTR